VDISACGHLCALPDLLCGILPNVQRMPAFLAQLSRCLPWRGAQQRAAIAEVEWGLLCHSCALVMHTSTIADGSQLCNALPQALAMLYTLPQEGTTDIEVCEFQQWSKGILPWQLALLVATVHHQSALAHQGSLACHLVRNLAQGVARLAQQLWKPSRACASRGVLVQIASLHDLYRTFERC
jgi:DNA mismatch repair protein Mlh1 C-terminus